MSNENKWKKINVVFRLKSPLHIGYTLFKGSVVSPTRYYVPGRNLWGAVTKRTTEYLYRKPRANDYKKIAKCIIENFRFSYFYLYDEKTIYFPCYTEKGFKYGNLTKAEFEHRFIRSIISTAIDGGGTAKNGSLHEIEFINNNFKDKNGNINAVKIVGCIWFKENARIGDNEIISNDKGIFIKDFNIIKELILGGESKYGFGHVLLESVNKSEFSNFAPFKWENPEDIKINSDELLVAHLKYAPFLKFEGNFELLTGRGYFDPEKNENNESNNDKPGKVISKPEYYISPGSTVILKEKNFKFEVNWDGTLKVTSNKSY